MLAETNIISNSEKNNESQLKGGNIYKEGQTQGLDGDIWKMTLDAIEKEESRKRYQGLLPENFDLILMKQVKDISIIENRQKSQSSSKQNQRDYKDRERDVQKLLYADQITELFIDEILYDSVGVLNTWDEQYQKREEERRNQQAMDDYIEVIKDFTMTQNQIDARVEKSQQSMMNFRKTQIENDPFLQMEQMEKDVNFFKNPKDRVRSIEISSGFKMRLLDERKRRINYIRKKVIYQPKNLEIINQLVSQIGESIIHQADEKMETYTEQIAAQIFQNEFK